MSYSAGLKLCEMKNSEENLFKFYSDLSELRYDFRNYNLTNLLAGLVEGQTVLDIGCGNGFLLSLLAQRGKDAYGVEPSEELVGLSRKFSPGLKVFRGAAEDIEELFDIKFDSVLLIDVLEHLENDAAQLRKIRGILKNNGTLVLVVPAYEFFYGNRDRKYGHFRRYSRRKLINLLEKSGFEIKSLRYWNMVGVLPYLIYEKILRRELSSYLRQRSGNIFQRMLNGILNFWFKYIENNLNLGFGLSLICVAKKDEPNILT